MNNPSTTVPEESKAMQEIRAVRRQINTEIENLTPEERREYFAEGSRQYRELADKLAKEGRIPQRMAR